MAFPFFGKKSTSPPSAPTGVAPRTTTRVRTDPLGPRTAGVAPAFQDSVPGRFGRRGLKNLPNPDAAGANSIYEVSNTGMHGLVPSVTELEGGPMTQAAFTQMPSELDLSAATRRPVPGAIEVPTPIENCVISHANGEAAEALRGLEAEIDRQSLGAWTLQAWLMRFDLLEQLGDRSTFEEKANEFASLFDRSRPTWPDPTKGAARDLPDVPVVGITGHLSAASSAPLSALRKTIDRYVGVRLDFERLASVDQAGCRYLLVTLQGLKRVGKVVQLANEDNLLRFAREHARPGEKASDPSAWLLIFELLQYQRRRDDFMRTALDYALTFDVAAPQWDDASERAINVTLPERLPALHWLVLEGELTAPADGLLARIQAHADLYPTLVIDLSRVQRIDFMTASQVANRLNKLRQDNHEIEIRSPNQMVATLLVLMGAGEVARIVPRR